MTDAFHHFYKHNPDDRFQKICEFVNISPNDVLDLQRYGLSLEQADSMIENVIGTLELPVGVGVHFVINGKQYVVPMVIEESSVVAAASKLAKIAAIKGGFCASSTEPIMIGQIQITDVADPFAAKMAILQQREKFLQMANCQDPALTHAGGGAVGLEVRVIDSEMGPMVICHLLVDCQDAMGANAVNTMVEALASEMEEVSGGKVCLRIISNFAVHRLARVNAVFDKTALGGEEIVDRMLAAYHFANADIYRATTHNKGTMNGVIAVAIATGQDTRAIEAGAHAYACRYGSYRSLTVWEKTPNGDLKGSLELPMAVGIIGGVTKVHPVVKANLEILNIDSAQELGQVMVAVGLAQNAAAMRALAHEGIQRGHMALHARNIAVMAGAPPKMIDIVVERLLKNGRIRIDCAEAIVRELNNASPLATKEIIS